MYTNSELQTFVSDFSNGNISLSVKTDAEKKVINSRWATGSMSNDIPFDRELKRRSVARWIGNESADPSRHTLHGFDEQERIITECSPERDNVILYGSRQRVIVSFLKAAAITTVAHLFYEDGRVVTRVNYSPLGREDTHYEYEGGILKSAVVHASLHGDPVATFRQIFSYDADGVLSRVDSVDIDEDGADQPESHAIDYMRLPLSETVETLEVDVQASLEKEFAAAVKEISCGEKLYCVLLNYGDWLEQKVWPPTVLLVGDSKRCRVPDPSGEVYDCEVCKYNIVLSCQRKGDVEWYRFEDQSLLDACVKHAYLLDRDEDFSSAINVLDNLCRSLETMIREAGVPVTDDFFVGHVDATGAVASEYYKHSCVVSKMAG